MADSVRTLRVELQAGIASFQKGFKDAGSSVNNLSKTLGSLNKPLTESLSGFAGIAAPIGVALGAVGAAVAFAAKQTIAYSDAIGVMSERSGHSVEWLQATKFAAEQSGATIEDVATSSKRLAKALGEGSEKTAGTLRALGLSLQELKKASPDEAMNRVLKAIGQVENPTLRTAAAMQLMGRSGNLMIPLAADFDRLRERAEALGLVMSAKDVAAAKELGHGLEQVSSAFGGLVRSIGAAITSNESLHVLVYGLADIFGNLSKAVNANRVGMTGLVSGGVIFLAKGLIFLADVVQLAVDVWDSLRLAWNAIYLTALNVSLGIAKVGLAVEQAFGTEEGVRQQKETIALLEAEKLAVGRNADAIISSNTAKTNAIQGVRSQLVQLEKNVEAAAGKEVKLGDNARKTGRDLDLEGESAKKLADGIWGLANDLDRAFAEAGARGMSGLEGAFAKVDADAMKWSQKLAELVKNGLDPESAAAFREEIDRLAVSLRANALEAERQKVLGKTFSDVALEAKNLQQVLSTVSLKSLTPDALTALEVTLTKLVELGQPFVAQLAAVRDRMREIGATTPEQARQLQLNLQLVDQMAQSEQHVAELRQAANDQQARQFGELSQTLSSYRDLVDTVGASFVALGRISQESLDGISTAFASASRQAQAFAEVASTGALSAASALDLARQSFAGGAGAQSFLGGLAQGVAGGSPLLGVIGFFAGNRSRQQMRDVGRTWGVAISDELAKQIEKDAKRLGSSVAAQLVNLPKIIEEAGGIGTFGVDKAIGALGDLMAQMKAGKVSVAEAGKVFDEVFGELAPKAIDKTTGLASKAFADLIQKAKAAGIESQAMTQFLADQTTKLGTALEAVAKGAIITAKSAAGVGAAVVAEFEQLRASGMSAKDALDQIQPTIDALRDKLAEIGVSGGAAFDQLAAESALLHDEVGGPLMEAILGASDAIVALANSGALTQETFGGLTAAIGDTYAKLQEEGKSGPAALALMQPSLQAMWEAEQRFGYTADASTQALIDQAVATGQVGEAHKSATERMVDATQRVADILEAVARKMGVEIPEAAQKGAQGIQDAFGGVSVDIPVNYTGGELPGMPGVPAAGVPSFASGGIGDFGSGALAILHGPEAIVPLTGGGSPTAGGILGGTTINQFVSFDENPLQTFEGLRRQREFTVRAMQREAGRNLPTLVAAGRA